MANDNNIKTFTASDIEKYHQGLLSAKERHELEKAALDDPFLADAIEGYETPGVHAGADIAELKNRLAQKTEQTRVIPLLPASSNKFSWWKVAAMIVLIAGAGFITYQVAFPDRKKTDPITQVNSSEKSATESIGSTMDSTTSQNANNKPAGSTEPGVATQPGDDQNNLSNRMHAEQNGGQGSTTKKYIQLADSISGANGFASAESPIVSQEKEILQKADKDSKVTPVTTNAPVVRPLNPPPTEVADARHQAEIKATNAMRDRSIAMDHEELSKRKAAAPAAPNKTSNSNNYGISNNFRGRVTDENNVGLPFANVTNTRDNVGTYSDAKGYFNLISSDSVMNVQVRSTGFANNNVQLKNTLSTNQIVLQEDQSIAAQTLSTQKVNAQRRSAQGSMKLEGEPEPEDGWENYDSYLSNNLNVNDEVLRMRQSNSNSAVELSFEVNKDGSPINFKIEKSLCAKCDAEAIRLVKEGPKWKKKNKKSRTTVTISF